jgi:uncharacterized membrane protein YfhO
MVFGYYGTSCYSSFNNVNYMNFLIALDTIPPGKVDAAAFWSTGLLGHSLLSTFACEKYVLAAGLKPYPTADYYELVKRYEDIYLLRNQMFLPLGLTFSRYLPQETFRQMPTSAKPLALLHTAVLADETAALRYGLLQWSLPELQQQINETSLPDAVALRRNSALAIQSFSDTRIDGTVHLDEKGILILQTPFDRGWRAFQDGRDAPVLKVDVGLLGVVLDSGEHQIELRYRPPMLLTGAAVSLASLLIFAFCLWRWPRVRLPA